MIFRPTSAFRENGHYKCVSPTFSFFQTPTGTRLTKLHQRQVADNIFPPHLIQAEVLLPFQGDAERIQVLEVFVAAFKQSTWKMELTNFKLPARAMLWHFQYFRIKKQPTWGWREEGVGTRGEELLLQASREGSLWSLDWWRISTF